jgi:hypothetical protein
MQAVSYRLCRETCVVCSVDGKVDLLTIPEGSIVTVAGEPSPDTGMVAVMWGAKIVRMFNIDLQQRGEMVTTSAA